MAIVQVRRPVETDADPGAGIGEEARPGAVIRVPFV